LLSGDLFNLYVTLELLGLSAVALASLGGKTAAVQAALRYLLVGLLGSMMFLAGVSLIYAGYGTLDLATLAGVVEAGPVAWTALALMTAGLLLKTALFPLHFWLPPAHASAPAPVSAVLSALYCQRWWSRRRSISCCAFGWTSSRTWSRRRLPTYSASWAPVR
jgi:formate hydrogenlyase subunit 3/multisubunit Na+/H+ antiporter MnhD subunit